MICFMETAAADDFEAAMRHSPTTEPVAVPRSVRLGKMSALITELLRTGEPVMRDDFIRAGFAPEEIDALAQDAMRHAVLELEHLSRPR